MIYTHSLVNLLYTHYIYYYIYYIYIYKYIITIIIIKIQNLLNWKKRKNSTLILN